MTSDNNTKNDARRAAVAMLRLGIATLSEVARLAGVSRQLAAYWADSAEVDASQARADRLAREWRRRLG